MTQIVNNNHLAPEIQEELFHLPSITYRKDPIYEKMLRPIVAETNRKRQRPMWAELVRS